MEYSKYIRGNVQGGDVQTLAATVGGSASDEKADDDADASQVQGGVAGGDYEQYMDYSRYAQGDAQSCFPGGDHKQCMDYQNRTMGGAQSDDADGDYKQYTGYQKYMKSGNQGGDAGDDYEQYVDYLRHMHSDARGSGILTLVAAGNGKVASDYNTLLDGHAHQQ